MTAFPFAITHKTLRGEPYKSLASLALSRHLIDLPGEFTWQVGDSARREPGQRRRSVAQVVLLARQAHRSARWGRARGAQATCDGHPLCTYAGDGCPGQANGYDLNGGLWYEVRVSG